MKGEEIKNKKKNNKKKKDRIEQPYRHFVRVAYGSTMEFTMYIYPFLPYIEEKKIRFIRFT